MKFLDMIENIDIINIKGKPDIEIKGIAYNSSTVQKDYIFVAIEGMKVDGHNYIEDAIDRGATVLFVTKDIKAISGMLIVKVADTRVALSALSAAFYGNPTEKMKLIGVTGTNGKTTTTYLIQSILKTMTTKTGLIGTLGVITNDQVIKTGKTTPESLELQGLSQALVNAKTKVCLMEVSSHSLKLKRVHDCDFDIGVFTNLTHEHLDFHKTMEEYYQAKRALFLMTHQFNIINIDDPFGDRLAKELVYRETPLLTYGIESKADIMAKNIVLNPHGSQFTLVTPDGEITINTVLPGKYNVYNGIAAAAAAYAMGIELANIKAGLSSIVGVPGRFEQIPTQRDFNVIIDYAHTPDGLENLFETVSKFVKGRIILVFGCVGERDHSKRKIMGEIAARYSDLCVLTTDNCRSEDPQVIINNIKEGFSEQTPYVEILDREVAIQYALANAQKDDTILITGKGHERQQIIGNQVNYFNEKAIIKDALSELTKSEIIAFPRQSALCLA